MKVYIITAPADQPKVGDFDYANSLSRHVYQSQHISDSSLSGKEIINLITDDAEKIGETPVLHLMLSFLKEELFTGSSISLEDLREFRKKNPNGRIVITFIEYAKASVYENRKSLEIIDEYARNADKVIFIDEKDQEVALSTSLVKQIQDSTVIHIPNTVSCEEFPDIINRGKNILSFGIIRPYKGIEDKILLIARMLKEKGSNRKVLLVGSISEHPYPERTSILLKNILLEIFPSKKDDIEEVYKEKMDHVLKIRRLLEFYTFELQFIEPSINVELHFNVPEVELTKYFKMCSYFISFHNPTRGGVSAHFSGVTNAIISGMKIVGNAGVLTPDYFRKDGKYRDMIFLSDNLEEIIGFMDKFDSDIEGQRLFKITRESYLKSIPTRVIDVADKHIDLYCVNRMEALKMRQFLSEQKKDAHYL